MKINREGIGGKGHKMEDLPSMEATVTITGGGEFQRRVQNDYHKVHHKEHDDAVKEAFGALPDVSVPFIVGGTR